MFSGQFRRHWFGNFAGLGAVAQGQGVFQRSKALGGGQWLGEPRAGEVGQLQGPPFVEAGGAGGEAGKGLVEQGFERARIGGQRAQKALQARAALWLIQQCQHQRAAGAAVDGARDAVESVHLSINDLVNAVDFARLEDGAKQGAGASQAAIVHGFKDTGQHPLGQKLLPLGAAFLQAQHAFSQQCANHLRAQQCGLKVGAQCGVELDVESAVGDL